MSCTVQLEFQLKLLSLIQLLPDQYFAILIGVLVCRIGGTGLRNRAGYDCLNGLIVVYKLGSLSSVIVLTNSPFLFLKSLCLNRAGR